MLDKQLLALIKGNTKYIWFTVVINIVAMAANIAVTAGVCLALSGLWRSDNLSAFTAAMILIPCGIVVRVLCGLFAARFKFVLGERVKRDLRAKTYDKILKLNMRSAEQMSMAGLTQVSVEGIEQLDLYYTSYLPQFFYSMIAPILLFGVCVFIDWRTALVLLACVPLIPVSIIIVSKKAKKIFTKYWGKYTSMGDSFLDSVQGMKELKIFDADARQNDKMNANAEEFRRITMKVLVMQLFSITIMDLVAFGGAGLGVAIAVNSAVNHGLSPFLALFLILVSAEFFLPLRALGSAFHVAMNGASAGKKIIDLLNAKEPTWGEGALTKVDDIAFDNVTFSYDKDRKILDNVSAVFEKNKLTAIVGESGSGKSTIAMLLTGAHKPECGKITIGDIEINSLSRQDYYAHLAVVSYNTYIFNDTVRNNFYLSNPQVTDEEIWNALNRVNLAKFIQDNGGLDKSILEDADNISGGQKQRLALAVNLVSNKSICIFDEATSNIDVESESIIIDNIYQLKKNALIILISHRLENVVNADKILVLKDGKIIESGSHTALVSNRQEYAKLYHTQKSLELGYTEGVQNA